MLITLGSMSTFVMHVTSDFDCKLILQIDNNNLRQTTISGYIASSTVFILIPEGVAKKTPKNLQVCF